jgi:spermidine synthase
MHGGSFDDPRVEIQYRDARDYLEHSNEKFDVIISDLPEPLEAGPAWRLYTCEFYRLVQDHLIYTGAFAAQAGIAKHAGMKLFAGIYRTLQEVLPIIVAYQTFAPCFGVPLGFVLAGNSITLHHQDQSTIDNLIALRVGEGLRYWDGETHRHAFALPKHIRGALSNATRVGTDDKPLHSKT